MKGEGDMQVQVDTYAGTEVGGRAETGDDTGNDGGDEEIWAKAGVYSYI